MIVALISIRNCDPRSLIHILGSFAPVFLYSGFCFRRSQTLFLPNPWNAAELVERVASMIEANVCNFDG